VPGPGISWARTRYDSAAGEIAVHWNAGEEGFVLEARIPEGVPAEIVLPGGATHEVVGGEHRFVA
ncbi:alpha-L-rhamnosidase C-terminal domain-containing protein, partial [Microbacterium sp. 13-71-7]|uniref:alpha-L-rhamnosidase C-terminal domain-containing protein n=1 Tax=Microbacterium sp. 13-71-7 TaxID=1970399 RepID=UPI000BC552EB